jgi:hypothetical protein
MVLGLPGWVGVGVTCVPATPQGLPVWQDAQDRGNDPYEVCTESLLWGRQTRGGASEADPQQRAGKRGRKVEACW